MGKLADARLDRRLGWGSEGLAGRWDQDQMSAEWRRREIYRLLGTKDFFRKIFSKDKKDSVFFQVISCILIWWCLLQICTNLQRSMGTDGIDLYEMGGYTMC